MSEIIVKRITIDSGRLKENKMAHAVDLLKSVEQLTENRPELEPGDTVNVKVRIVEGTRERVQPYQGVVIALKGSGMNRKFTVRRVASHGIGVERTFLFYSPRIESIEVLRHAKVRRAKLYFLRDRSGKSARLKERRFR
jgi:large subunit ribosomal protein L19